MSFFILEENYGEVKKIIRGCSSLRFDYNPVQLNGEYRISISGSHEHLNIINAYLAKIEKLKTEKKKGLLEKLADAIGFD